MSHRSQFWTTVKQNTKVQNAATNDRPERGAPSSLQAGKPDHSLNNYIDYCYFLNNNIFTKNSETLLILLLLLAPSQF